MVYIIIAIAVEIACICKSQFLHLRFVFAASAVRRNSAESVLCVIICTIKNINYTALDTIFPTTTLFASAVPSAYPTIAEEVLVAPPCTKISFT